MLTVDCVHISTTCLLLFPVVTVLQYFLIWSRWTDKASSWLSTQIYTKTTHVVIFIARTPLPKLWMLFSSCSSLASSLHFCHLSKLRSILLHTFLFLTIVPLSASTCSMVHWLTVNPIRGQPSAPPAPPQAHYLALIHQMGSQAVHHPATTHPRFPPVPSVAAEAPAGGPPKLGRYQMTDSFISGV